MTPLQIITLIFTSFILFNTINTYFLTYKKLNRYIAPFKHTFIGELNALFGNVGTLLLFLTIGIFIFKDMYSITIYLLILSIVLNIFFFAISVFSLYYGNVFSKSGFDIFKNPSAGISKGLFGEIIGELFKYYRVLLFIPTISMSLVLVFIESNDLKNIVINFDFRTYSLYVTITLILLIVSYILYRKMFIKELPIKSAQTTYAIQNYGVYPYYIIHLISPNFEPNIEKLLNIHNQDELFLKISKYNKNQKTYTNQLDNSIHSNRLTKNDLAESITINDSLIKNSDLHGILKGKNLVLIQMESMNSFLLDLKNDEENFPFLKELLKESLVFDNFYTSVGIGVSSDAEVTTLTGLYPSGSDNYYWKSFNRVTNKYKSFVPLTTLPKYFNQKNYKTLAIHGDQAIFYNRNHAYKNLIDFNDFYSLESFDNLTPHGKIGTAHLYKFEYLPNKFHVSPWASDYQLFEKTNELMKNEKNNYMYFPITMMPHTPFEYHPNEELIDQDTTLNPLTNKYLSFASYYDNIIKRLFIDRNGNNVTDSNNVYLFYGDHGSGLRNNDLYKLFNKDIKKDPLFERDLLQKVMCFLYVPSNDIDHATNIKNGLITGNQPLVRGQMDIYRSVIELFDLDCKNDLYFGTHLFSTEKTFVLDNKMLDVATDDAFFSLRDPKYTRPTKYQVPIKTLKVIKETKLINDLLFQKESLQEKINIELNKKKD
ncbi:LTA synthase family protein [Haploplasma axanthum]|uniref:Lipoteichoic acid synthase 1 n=1 Tax=Haploplasma axanthum TaxID=29552 RepID=A0A449BEH4_HAPAX|nr:alkaline phosphatase family protein [Haploplasma axanthum]VEU80851.1 Lipoteichoic acid synthase 1 [Haploplasma axanthum]